MECETPMAPNPHPTKADPDGQDGTGLPGMTGLEEALNGSDGATVRADALMRLDACRSRLAALRTHELCVQTFTASERLTAALDAATTTLLTPRKET